MEKKVLKQAILKSSLVYFKNEAFHKVSTNDIVLDAGVSKGLLFHYFNDKRSLYLTLYEHVWGIVHEHVMSHPDMHSPHLFVRLNHYFMSQKVFLTQNDDYAQFLKRVHLNTDDIISKRRNAIYASVQSNFYKHIFEGIDTSVFYPHIALPEAYRVIIWTLQRISADWEKNHKDASTHEALSILNKELNHYLHFFENILIQKPKA